jgi:acyl-CoA thioesterase YciA
MPKVTSKLCMQKDLGVNGNLFGGNMMAWVDEAAAIYAHQTTMEKHLVTKKLNEMIFSYPVKEGDILEFFCETLRIGNTSMTIKVVVFKSERGSLNVVQCLETTAIFIAVDSNGCKKQIERKILQPI